MIPYPWLEQARERIAPYIHQTPLTYDAHHDLYLKWENHQVTGSFKARGALNKILSLQDWELECGLVTASAGNHGQGVAMGGQIRRAAVIIFASEHTPPNKVESMRSLGAEIHLVGGGYAEAEQAGISYANDTNATWISPYNDGLVIAGQGTIALEILPELPDPSATTWLIPTGGGGLISGIGSAFQPLPSRPRLIAVQSEASPYFHAIFHQGSQEGVIELPSLAEGLAGPVEQGSVTIPMVMSCVDDIILVSEDEIRKAIKFAWTRYHERIEGSAAVTLAAVISGRVAFRPAIAVLTGGNINPPEFTEILADISAGFLQV